MTRQWLGIVVMGWLSAALPMPTQAAFPNTTTTVIVNEPAAEQGTTSTEKPRKRPIRDWCRNHPCHCWSNINHVGCGGIQAECTFIFGSCRKFFGEPCLRQAPEAIPGLNQAPSGCSCP